MPVPPPSPGRQHTPSLGEILDRVIRKEGLGRKLLQGRRLARKVLAEKLGPALSAHADVASVKTGVVTLEADSSPLFQELEGYRREELVTAFRAAGLQVREVRVRLQQQGVGERRDPESGTPTTRKNSESRKQNTE